MNGQPYNYSGSNSGNGTPTPSSISYPASLSSQSSRDASPARGPNNHVDHKYPDNYNYARPAPDPDLDKQYYAVNSKGDKMHQDRGDYTGQEFYPNYGYQEQQWPQTYQQNPQTQYNSEYRSPTQQYSPRLPQPTGLPPPVRPNEEPISSGPPRTNVLGIIPYAEPVTSVSQLQSKPPAPAQPMTNYVSAPNVMTPYGLPQYAPQAARVPPLVQPPPSSARAPSNPPPPPKPYPNQYPNVRPPENHVSQQPRYQNYPFQQQQPPQQQQQQQIQQQNNAGGYPSYSQMPVGYYPGADDLANQIGNMNIASAGYNKLWGREAVDLLKTRDILPQVKVEAPAIRLNSEFFETANCSPEIFRCTLTKIPETKSLLDKSRLPLGILIHPFKDLNQLSVIQCSAIVRCRSCRTYINPFVQFVDSKRWKCNLCFRVNDLPEEFQYDPLTKTYGDPSRRPEIKSATIEFIAPSEYMVRPPQPAAYVFVIDVSRLGAEAGYLQVFCDCLLSQLEALPGDSRTSVGFITYDSNVHYYSLGEAQAQPHQMVIVDIDDMFVPCPDNLLVNLSECLGLVRDLLKDLPTKYSESFDTGSALGPALQAAYKLLAATGGRITVFQSCLPNCGPGKLPSREDPAQRSGENVNQVMLNPVTDFYKKLALDCSGQQIAVDLFILNSQYVDLATLSGVSQFSGGCIHHFPFFNIKNQLQVDSLQRSLHRYLCRKIGFESVMRLRCTRGLSIHTFHGNFFVRSTDLLSLPNVNPDAGFGMQVSIDENLSDVRNVCFQAALLYTSSKGERRIRVHTLCLPIASNLSDVLHSADQQCIIGLLAKMAVDRCHQSSLGDAREAFINVVADILSVFKLTQSSNSPSSLLAPPSLSILPLYILALMKYIAFRIGQSTRLDDRVFAMCQMKSLPLSQLIQAIYPDLYPVHNLLECPKININDETIVQPPLLHLTAERIDSSGIYLMDDGTSIIIYVGHNISPSLAISLFCAPSFNSINPSMYELPELNNPESIELRNFVNYLQNEKPVAPTVEVIRDDSPQRHLFIDRLIEDKTESGHSYYEFLQRVKQLVK